jgi:class 3 adenylate cyclase
MRAAVEPGSPVVSLMRNVLFFDEEDPARIRCPTLVLQRSEATATMDSARHLAAHIPNAELVLFEGASLIPWVGEMEPIIATIDRFLGVATQGAPATGQSPAGGMVTLLFTDIEGSTTLTQRLGDAGAQEIVRAHNNIVREALARYGGTEVKQTGDGIMASFPLASSAIEASIAIQRSVASHAATPFRVRIGLNAGEPVAEERDLYGTAVQMAARVCAQAEAGTILVTDVVRQLAAGKGFLFGDTGDATLRGFEDPVRLFEVRWQP